MPRYAPLETAVLELVLEIDVSDRRDTEVAALDRLIAADTLKIENLDVEITAIVNVMLKGGVASDAVAQMIAAKEAEKTALKAVIAENQHKRDVVASRLSPNDRRAAMKALRKRMEQATGSELFAIRASLNQKVREAVDRMEFDKNGRVTINLHGTSDQYVMSDIKRDDVTVKRSTDGRSWEIFAKLRGADLDSSRYRLTYSLAHFGVGEADIKAGT